MTFDSNVRGMSKKRNSDVSVPPFYSDFGQKSPSHLSTNQNYRFIFMCII